MIERTIPEDFVDLANVQAAHESQLLARQNVVGVALGNNYVGGQDTGDRALTVLVESKMPDELLSEDDRVPGELDGVTTDVQEVGVIQAGGGPVFDTIDPAAAATQEVGPFTLRQRARPAFGGVSIGHFQITAGTLSTCCYDLNPFPSVPSRYYVLSNNHVLANSNNANIGDPILQPGPFDGGTIPNDVIARLTRFVPIRFIAGDQAPCNFVDCAVAEGRFEDLDRRIYWVGDVKRIFVAPTLGMVVEKCGRTTNFTTGTVTNINATVDVNYGGGRVARFCNQIITTNMSAGGDSGSLVCDLDEGAVSCFLPVRPKSRSSTTSRSSRYCSVSGSLSDKVGENVAPSLGVRVTSPQTFEQALAAASSWMGSIPGVVAVGEGEEAGERTIDVWVTGASEVQLPQDLAPFQVRIRPSGGPIHALETEEAGPDEPTAR